MELMDTKQYPDNYSSQVLDVLTAMSMSGMKKLVVVGSASVRSQLYAGDYDAVEKVHVNSVSEAVAELRNVVKRLRSLGIYIGDIKCGEAKEWNIFRPTARLENDEIKDFNKMESKGAVDVLLKEHIISPAEHKKAQALLDKSDTPFGFLDAKKQIRFHILRWKPMDIINGALDYRGAVFPLESAIESGGMLKVDTIADINNQFTEFSVIYEVYVKKKRITALIPSLVSSIEDDIVYFETASPFKALKRMFSLARYYHEHKLLEKLVPILNGDLGRLYQMIGDLITLSELLARPHAPVAQIREQIDEIRSRYGNLYQIKSLVSAQHKVISNILKIVRTPTPKLRTALDKLIDELKDMLDKETFKHVERLSGEKSYIGAGWWSDLCRSLDDCIVPRETRTPNRAYNREIDKFYNTRDIQDAVRSSDPQSALRITRQNSQTQPVAFHAPIGRAPPQAQRSLAIRTPQTGSNSRISPLPGSPSGSPLLAPSRSASSARISNKGFNDRTNQ